MTHSPPVPPAPLSSPASATPPEPARRSGLWQRILLGLLLTVLVVVSLLWLAGKFSRKIDATAAPAAGVIEANPGDAVAVRAAKVPVIEQAIGTVRAAVEITLTSKLPARIVEMDLRAGQEVKAGQVLARLDASDLQARLEQARAALSSAEAMKEQADRDEKRLSELVSSGAAARSEYERTATRARSAAADVEQAKQLVKETESVLAYTVVAAPIDGVIIDRRVEVGDTLQPGQVILTMFDPHRMQLVASVRESLAYRLRAGQDIGVRIDALDQTCTGKISEIVPEAQAASRTFQVKVTGPCPPGIYSGMSGRLEIPLEDETVLLAPAASVRRVGQLQLVDVAEGGVASRRAVRTGRRFGDDVEILSGLREGEQVRVNRSTGQGA